MRSNSPTPIALLLLAFALAAAGCASVRVIQPVASQNQRNAVALQKNTAALLAVTDDMLPALLEVAVVDAYRDTILAIRNSNKPTTTDKKAISAEYREGARTLEAQIEGIDTSLRARQIEYFHRQFPLTAAVAFAAMPAEDAASIWLGIEKGYEMSDWGTPASSVFKVHMELVSRLSYPSTVVSAKHDILDAYHELRSLLVQQSQNARDLAQQLSEASQTRQDPEAFLAGVLENTTFLTAIAESVAKKTGNPDRKKAAEALLASLRSESAPTDLSNAGGK